MSLTFEFDPDSEHFLPVVQVEKAIFDAGPQGISHNDLCTFAQGIGLSLRELMGMLSSLKQEGVVLKGGQKWVHTERIPPSSSNSFLSKLREAVGRAGFKVLDSSDVTRLFGSR